MKVLFTSSSATFQQQVDRLHKNDMQEISREYNGHKPQQIPILTELLCCFLESDALVLCVALKLLCL